MKAVVLAGAVLAFGTVSGEQADALLRSYWGGMVRKGADTFWEVWVPDDELASPYGSPLVNSYCHAWSAAPSYFLRQMETPKKENGVK